MLTSEGLREIHARTHKNLADLLTHCHSLDGQEVDQEIPEFNGASVRLQLHHIIGAEKYWIGVLEGRIDADEDAHLYPTIETLEAYRSEVHSGTQNYLQTASAEVLGTPRLMTTYGGAEHLLIPGHIVMRTITHAYHHMGQVASMLRLLDHPSPGFDYSIR